MTDFADGFSKYLQIVSSQGSATSMPSRLQSFDAVINHEQDVSATGGRSQGARAAALAALHALSANKDVSWAKQLVLERFPLFGEYDGVSRAPIILELPADVEVLFVSGDQDSMCDLDQLNQVRREVRAHSWLLEVPGACHSMEFDRANAVVAKAMRAESGRLASQWLAERHNARTTRRVYWNWGLMQIEDSGWTEEIGIKKRQGMIEST
ncbi:hypothetical protein CLAFUW4_06930 [Fulvia fulva]|nr:hypothetical protein CLAFUR4_06939 [Fulvia fulva]WPV15689.1 hypothetical protein CLAFUW4_06930 [Fulvia fulva]WPV30807.1 hypothetical protein CLAFUW7_06930 [Fulvia fulva]